MLESEDLPKGRLGLGREEVESSCFQPQHPSEWDVVPSLSALPLKPQAEKKDKREKIAPSEELLRNIKRAVLKLSQDHPTPSTVAALWKNSEKSYQKLVWNCCA